MSPPAHPFRDDGPLVDATPAGGAPALSDRWVEQATWAFVGLGVLARVARYLLNYPLWWDEAFVAVNFLRRDYLDLLRPLDYGQVCPLLFLWAELTTVKLFGVSEWSLRLFPLACGVASVVLFRRAAGRVVRGVPWLLAVAIFAAAYHPIRHAADVKPYASDLFAALALLALAFEWLRAPDRTGWLWALAAAAPVAVALSHPAIFVAGGIAAGLAPAVARTARRPIRIAFAAFLLTTAATFATLYAAFTRAQAAATLATMQAQWGAAFPPVRDPLALLRWFATTHTGSIFAYPCGGERGASGITFCLFLAGAVALWRRDRRTILATCLAPFGLAFAAAALRRYPYGGVTHGVPARVMQYLAPSICLLAGVGAATVLESIPRARLRLRGLRLGVIALAAIAILPLAFDASHPYRAVHAEQARRFARWFWPELARDAEVACLRWDFGIGAWDSTNLNVAVYLCNQRIYSPQRRRGAGPRWPSVSKTRPLRCVRALAGPEQGEIATWLDAMQARFDTRGSKTVLINMAAPGSPPRIERYEVSEFVPR
jgi:hypothetical protein